MKWSERNTRTKETQASTSVRVTFFLTCTGLEPRRISMKGWICYRELEERINGLRLEEDIRETRGEESRV